MNHSAHPRNSLWIIYISLACVLFVLGVVGFARHASWHNLPLTLLDDIYLTLQLIPMNSGGVEPPVPVELELARFFIPLLAASAAVQAIFGIFREQIHSLRLPWLKNHIIVCGLSRKGFLLAGQFRKLGRDVVVIERDEENIWIESCRKQGMHILLGDAADPVLLRTAGVLQAEGLFAVCDDDGANADIALRAQALTRRRTGEALECLVHVSDPQLCDLLREHEAGLERSTFRLELFNVFERAARAMLREFPAWDEAHADQEAPPKILLIGLGRMGENLLINIARNWWSRTRRPTQRIEVTLIDRYAGQKSASLCIRYPQLTEACHLVPLQMEIRSPEFEQAEFLRQLDHPQGGNRVYICVDDDSLGLHAGLSLSRHLPGNDIPIVIRMTEESGRARLLELHQNQRGAHRNLYAFGYLEHTCTPALLHDTPRDRLARETHLEYVRTQTARAQSTNNPLVLSNPAMQPWETLQATYRRANYQWADHIPLLLHTCGYELAPLVDWEAPSMQFSPEEVEVMAQMEHDLWCRERLSDRRRYEERNINPGEKINPAFVNWGELSEDNKIKNREMVRNIPAFLGKAGFQVKKRSGNG